MLEIGKDVAKLVLWKQKVSGVRWARQSERKCGRKGRKRSPHESPGTLRRNNLIPKLSNMKQQSLQLVLIPVADRLQERDRIAECFLVRMRRWPDAEVLDGMESGEGGDKRVKGTADDVGKLAEGGVAVQGQGKVGEGGGLAGGGEELGVQGESALWDS
jgi:hypothetical protein